uniref:Mab-21 domain-containing protein n=1 Tax=Anopheles funestus TaxID=62324 RepID=A0A182RM72_ANOFN
MGRSQSKEQPGGSNPFEAEIARKQRREQTVRELTQERREQERRAQKARQRAEKEAKKQQKKKKKSARKSGGAGGKKQRKSKLDELRDTEPPPIVRKSKAKLEESDYDSEAKRRMQHQLAFNSDIFVLNQLVLGVQFYGNFEREMWEAVERNRNEENRRNGKTSRHCKTVILPDRLLEAVDMRVKFYAKHGPYKNRLLPLHTQTCYVVHDNIEITNPGDSSVYSILTDAPIYKLEIEDSLDDKLKQAGDGVVRKRRTNCHHGYIKLKSVEFIKPNNPPTLDRMATAQRLIAYGTEPGPSGLRQKLGTTNGMAKVNSLSESDTLEEEEEDDDDDEDDDNDEEDEENVRGENRFTKLKYRDSIMVKYPKVGNGVYGKKQPELLLANAGVPSTSTSSTSPPSSEYDYAYITAINTHQPLSVMRSAGGDEAPVSTTVLPDYCITTISCPIEVNEGYYSDDESEGTDKLSALYLVKANGTGGVNGQSSSRGKMNHLHHHPHHSNPEYTTERRQYLNSKGFLAYFVNLFQDTLASELDIPAEDLRNATWKGAVVYSGQWEIIPAILCPWPREAIEWVHRKRDVKINPLTRQKFQWPTQPMIQKVKSFGCHVIPIGYAPKQGQNRYRQLEWKIVFPEAERYLESCLTGTQIKIYMITVLLLKTFVEPNLTPGMSMFGMEHLRAHLFWQCETNYAAWPEDYLGEALLRFLNALLDRIKTHTLPDYFLPSRNLFENVPERVLVELHKRIFRITENPVMHMLIALRNLKLPSARLTFYPKIRIKRLYSYLVIDNPLKIVNPMLRDEDENLAAEDSDENDANEREIAVGSMAYYNQQEVESRRKRTRIVRFLVAEQLKKERAVQPERRQSVESIDLTFLPLKHMENLRRQLIYGLFVEHFLEMARVSCGFRTLNQALIYLRQAERLCNLLADDEGLEEARQYLNQIYGLRLELAKANAKGADRPALPKRTSTSENRPIVSRKPSVTRRNSKRTTYTNVRQTSAGAKRNQQQPRFFSPDNEDDDDDDDDEEWEDIERKEIELSGGAGRNQRRTSRPPSSQPAGGLRRIPSQQQHHHQQQQQISVQIHAPKSPAGPPRSKGPRPSSDDIDDISLLLGNVTVSPRPGYR